MRILCGILLLVAFVLHLLLGGVYIMASRYQPLAVPALGAPEEAAGGRQLALGVVVLVAGLAQLAAAVLVLRRRGPRFTMALAAGAAVGAGAVLLVEGPLTVVLLSLIFTAAALAIVAFGVRRRASVS
jgi:hypothetical protein